MSAYLSRAELAALTGSTLRRRQAAWLAREGWPHVIGWDGWPRVAREYHDRMLLGRAPAAAPSAAAPDLQAV